MIILNYLTYGFGPFLSFFGLILLYLLVVHIISPLLKLSFYKKQGLKTYFYPFIGSRKRNQLYLQKYGDEQAYFRELTEKEPNIRAEVVNFGAKPLMLLYDTKLIKEFYNKPMSAFPKEQLTLFTDLFGSGILLANGNKWKSHRKVISGVFHFEFIKSNIPLIVKTAKEHINELKSSTLKPIDVLDEVQKITGEVVGRTFFGENLNQYQVNGRPLTLHLAYLNQIPITNFKNPLFLFLLFAGLPLKWLPSHHKFLNEIKELRKLCTKIVQERKASDKKNVDMLGLLFEAQQNHNEEEGFTDDELVDEFITFFIAGMESTAAMVNMALYLLYKHPEYLERVKNEIEEVYNRNSPVTSDDLSEMDFTHAVLKETLRLYTPTVHIFPRVAEFDQELGDLKIKKGTLVQIPFMYNNSHEKHFDNPSVFNPDRWMIKRTDMDPFTYTPFSAGPRNCIGQHLVLVESKIILAEFIKVFEFKIVPEDYELKMRFAFGYRPLDKIKFALKLKN